MLFWTFFPQKLNVLSITAILDFKDVERVIIRQILEIGGEVFLGYNRYKRSQPPTTEFICHYTHNYVLILCLKGILHLLMKIICAD